MNPSHMSTTNVFTETSSTDITSFSTTIQTTDDGYTSTTQYINYQAILTATAIWSPTFLSIYVHINSKRNISIISQNNETVLCSNLFNNYTMSLIGGDLAICSWIYLQNEHIIEIDLPSIATIDIYDNYNLTIKDNIIEYMFNNQPLLFKKSIEINGIDYPFNITSPNIIAFIPSEIGICDDLILDAQLTTNLGGRNNAIFKWYIMDIDYTVYGKIVTIAHDLLLSIPVVNDIFIELIVTNWYNASSTQLFTVQQSNMNTVPLIELHGIDIYSANIGKLINNKIDIYSTVIFNDNCENKIDLNEIEYEINWMVYIEMQNENIDKKRSELLNEYLLSQTDKSSISIDVDTQLQSGLKYLFVMNFKCIGNNFICDVNATHSVIYQHSKIKCGIIGGDNELNGIKWNDFTAFQMVLNGALLSLDPDRRGLQHLGFNWTCIDGMYLNCNYLFESSDISNTIIDFSKITNNINITKYLFTFVLEVSDMNNFNREKCIDSVRLNANIMPENSNVPDMLIISTTAINNVMNINDKLRIIVDILNKKK
eukprot:548272_1